MRPKKHRQKWYSFRELAVRQPLLCPVVRELYEDIKLAILKCLTRHGICQSIQDSVMANAKAYTLEANDVLTLVNIEYEGWKYWGLSKRATYARYADKPDPDLGYVLAFSRAANCLAGYLAEHEENLVGGK